ncbi:ROK family protein [Streptomyces caniscabiei]|uniref:ROK family protein n=1 Tax=Streptomyces caniscabiei TaxID=2746961 RepID=UPI0029A789FC|nr:ROK family protein [Streptomyces caniscabiei]MDX2776265.1 ROK family protein [Streptomyces caniscabiei]
MLVAVDTGGTKTLIARFEQDGSISKSLKFPTPADQQEYVTLLRSTLEKEFSDHTVEALVIGLPGIIKDGIALWCDNLGWKDFDAHHAFNDLFGESPVLIENDANLAGLAETRTLDPTPTSALYVTLSTGIGTGVITNGRIDAGLRHSEGGHMLIEYGGKLQEWEDFASGRSIYQTYGQYARDIVSVKTWDEIADRISRGFLTIIPMLQPDIVILGGSIGTYFERYNATLLKILETKLPAHIARPHFIQAAHPEQAVIYGCYYYALDYLSTNHS